MIRNMMLETFENYKKKGEKIGQNKLQKCINNGEICIIKTDKRGKIKTISKEDYLRMGNTSNAIDRKVSRKERKEIEKNINNATRMLIKVFNLGENIRHLQRIMYSKISNSE